MARNHCRQHGLPRHDVFADGDVHVYQGEISKHPHAEGMPQVRFLTPAKRGNYPPKQSVMPATETVSFAADREVGERHEESWNCEQRDQGFEM